MYTVTVEITKNKKSHTQIFELGEMDSRQYNQSMSEIADILYGLDLDFDDIDGDGDIMVDDILIAVSEEEEFEQKLRGKGMVCTVKGKQS